MDTSERLALTFGSIFLWVFGLLIFGSMGYSSQYFWTTISFGAASFGIAPFWRHRTEDWFYLSVGFIVLFHIFLLIYFKQFVAVKELPEKPFVVGLIVTDCMVSWSITLLSCRFLTRLWPWQMSDRL